MSIASETAARSAAAKLQLEPVLDMGAAERLHAQLIDVRGQSLEIDASQVERLGGLCLQVLQTASLTGASPAFEDAWAMFAAPALPNLTDPSGHKGQDA
jgi:hypothetical protein